MSRGPWIQMTTRTSAVVVWRTVGAIDPVVRYGTAPEALDAEIGAGQITTRISPEQVAIPELPRLHSAPADTFQYEASIGGLDENTPYYYGVFDGDTLLSGCTEDHFFRTLPGPDAGGPLRFWVTGDSGDGSSLQSLAFINMNGFVANDGRPVDAFIHLGDMAYNDGLDEEFQANFFAKYASLLRNTVVWPTIGNHEARNSSGPEGVGPYFDAYAVPTAGEAGGVASGTESYYSFDCGPIHFVSLNTSDEDLTAGPMLEWLEEDLAANDSEWLVVFSHQTPYTKGTHHSDAELDLIQYREFIMPILEAHGVDLVLTAHSHIYERSMLIDGAYSTPTVHHGVILDDGDGDPAGEGPYVKAAGNNPRDGTVVVVAGHGRTAARIGHSPVHRKSVVEVGTVLVDLDGDTMTVRMLDFLGAVRDEFQIVKRGAVVPRVPLSDPWSPLGPAIVSALRTSGECEVTLVARPDAPDATVFYTLDGSAPTSGSTPYTGPFTVSEPTLVQAVSTWRGGLRISPVASETIGPAVIAPATAHLLRIPVLDPEDDAEESPAGGVALFVPTLGLGPDGESGVFGLRFLDVRIPPGATVLAARLLLTPAQVSADPANWIIHADLEPQRAYGGVGDLTSRPRSQRSISWTLPEWSFVEVPETTQVSPDVSALVEEVVARPDWNTGDPLSFLITGTGARRAYSFDGNPDLAPELRLIHDERDALTVAADIQPVVELANDGAGGRRVLITLPVLESAPARGFLYTIEGSPSMDPDSWVPMGGSLDATQPSARAGFTLVRLQVARTDGLPFDERFFLRVRVTGP